MPRPTEIERKRATYRIWVENLDRLSVMSNGGVSKADVINTGIALLFEQFEMGSETVHALIREQKGIVKNGRE